MATEKKMDEGAFEAIVKEVSAFGELIRTHQDEKQSALDDFDTERDRYKAGKISKRALASSVIKVNKELKKLDFALRKDISNLAKATYQARNFALKQAPRSFRATMSGIKSGKR